MSIPVTCPSCAARFKAPDSAAGRKAKCAKCGASLVVGQLATVAATEQPILAEVADDEFFNSIEQHIAPQTTKRCRFCGEEILATAIKCKHCGEMLDQRAATAQPRKPKRRSLGRLALIALLIIIAMGVIGSIAETASHSGSSSRSRVGSLGQEVRLTRQAIMARDQESFDRFIKVGTAKDTLGISELLLADRLWLLEQ